MTQENPRSSALPDKLTTTAPACQLYGSETILLAEDDRNILKLVETILSTFGYEVITAIDGQDCINKFIENIDKIQLILMDMQMPKKNGQQAFNEIRQLKPDIKILFSSGCAEETISENFTDRDGIDLILKPVAPEDLLKKIRNMLGSQEA